MDVIITPSALGGEVAIIGSKSDIHRLMICSALSDAPTTIKGASLCDDIKATAECIKGLGAEVTFSGKDCTVYPGSASSENYTFNCKESGSTLRFMLPVAATRCKSASFTGSGRLPKRPIGELVDAMRSGGVSFSSDNLPLDISGTLRAGKYTLPGNVSSQYITGLLMALSVTEGESEIVLSSKLESASYVNMTLSTLRIFGARAERADNGYKIIGVERLKSPQSISADGDWSNAAFFLCSGAISGRISVRGLYNSSCQGDRKILSILDGFGAKISCERDTVTVSSDKLNGCVTDITDTPDLLPTLAVVAAYASGQSRFTGAARLRLKESDRLATVADMINSLGGDAIALSDELIVNGRPLTGGTVDGANDHRIVMAASIAAAHASDAVKIIGAQAVNKSYPSFFEDFTDLGGKADVI